jgi:hypothetical protein
MSTRLSATIPALVCLVLVACAPPQTPAQTGAQTPAAAVRSGGILRLGQSAGDVGTVDPHYASGTQDRALVCCSEARVGSDFDVDRARFARSARS